MVRNLEVLNDALSTAGSMNAKGVSDYSIDSGCETDIATGSLFAISYSCDLETPSANTRVIRATLSYRTLAKFIGRDEMKINLKTVAYHP